MKNVKARNWCFICYPDSLPINWIDILISRGMPFAISPLHEHDIDYGTGKIKKPHYHVILCYNGPTTYNHVCELVVEELGQPCPKVLDSVQGYFRYFTHKDNADKYQYDEKDIKVYNGFDLQDVLSNHDTMIIIKRIQSIIIEKNIFEYCDLLDYLNKSDLYDDFYIAATKTFLFTNYLVSRRNKKYFEQKAAQERLSLPICDSKSVKK